ncbi:MAG TPA: adenylate/guanylate cyclase domain-containing protein, partial [Candidatus Limnocylindria bacterium]
AGVGIHAGEAEDSDEGIVSSAVNIAARICAVAPAGEILVSETVRALTRSYLRDVRFVPRGQRRLKGISEPVRLYAVEDAGAERITPPPGRRRRVALIAASTLALVAATVAIAYVGGALTREGLAGQVPPGSPSPIASARNTSMASSLAPEATGSAGPRAPFPDAAELQLLARLPSTMSVDSCVRADEDEVPSIPPFHEPGLVPLPVSAALRCPMGSGLSVFFYAAGRCELVTACRSETETAVFSIASRRGVPEAECAPEVAALARWEFGDARGWVVCGDDTVWTYDDSNLLGRASSERPGVAYRWFHENARFPAE